MMYHKCCMFLPFTIVIFTILQYCNGKQPTGQFWHITDIHLDPNYTRFGGDPQIMCWAPTSQQEKEQSLPDVGKFGNHACDSPYTLVLSALQFMKQEQPEADFIIWTGDDVSHVNDDYFNSLKVLDIMSNITNEMKETFPNTPVFPSFGNHDVYPTNYFSPDNSDFWYLEIGKLWSSWLGEEAFQTFIRGGFYTKPHPTVPSVDIIALNTAIYNEENELISESTNLDPLDQFAWLEETLTQMAKNNKKAYISAHIPPGSSEKYVAPAGVHYFKPLYNKRFVDIIIKHSETIIGQFFGHEHTDTFKLYHDSYEKPVNVLFVAPAITPWAFNNNPGVRLVNYDLQTGLITNYQQFYLNLTEANLMKVADWKLEYDLLSAYNLPNVSYESLFQLAQLFAIPNDKYFGEYFFYNSVSYVTGCNLTCQRNQYCAITQLDYEAFAVCNRAAF
ncbi:Acid sphingomyelinase-like phosphodiesterase 3b [Chamberlinius hualienensis]